MEQARPEILSNASVDREALFASMDAMAFGTDFKPAELDTTLDAEPPAPENPRKSGGAIEAPFASVDANDFGVCF